MKPIQKVIFKDTGRISYKEAWDYQFSLQKALIDHKLLLRKLKEQAELVAPNTPSVSDSFESRVLSLESSLNTQNENLDIQTPSHYLLFCEHNPVYTLGKSGSLDNLLLNEEELVEKGIEFFKINRGGDITYHGPGQITGYPIFDMEYFFTDVHKYVRYLEEAIIRTLADYDIEGFRIKEYTGVWVDSKVDGKKRKICAIGVHFSRWVSMHGFAFNVNTDLQFFKNIIPCGIADNDKDVTSLSAELGRIIDINEVKNRLKSHFASIFEYQYV